MQPAGSANGSQHIDRGAHVGGRRGSLVIQPLGWPVPTHLEVSLYHMGPRQVTSQDGRWWMPMTVPMAHAIHHADRPRSHAPPILGEHALAELDVCGYTQSAGLMQKQQPAAGD